MSTKFSPVISALELHGHLNDTELLIVDVCAEQEFSAGHIPGAVQLDYAAFVASRPPVMGLIPDADQLSLVLSSLGLGTHRHIVAYDREGGGKAGRLLFTLDALDHPGASLLNGGLQAWVSDGYGTECGSHEVQHSQYQACMGGRNIATRDYILSRLNNPEVILLDCRSPAEYHGQDVRALRGGHIPGAVNLNWTETLDPDNSPQLLRKAVLNDLFESKGVTPDKEVIVYCQTHHRSSHTYMVLKELGYSNLKGYPGAWSEWGNDPATPVEN